MLCVKETVSMTSAENNTAENNRNEFAPNGVEKYSPYTEHLEQLKGHE